MEKEVSSPAEPTLERLGEMNKLAEQGGGSSRIAAQHQKGKKTARERIDLLLDEGSFVELDKFVISREGESSPEEKFYGDGVVTGFGTIDGRTVFLFSHDFTIYGGSLGEMFGKKINKVMDLAMKAGPSRFCMNTCSA